VKKLKSKWEEKWMCTECSYLTDLDYDEYDICFCCGAPKSCVSDKHFDYFVGWRKVSAKKISTSVWYKPWTWGKYYYEIRERSNYF
jgi:hypothetical protein